MSDMMDANRPIVVLVATGGTIAMKVDPALQAPRPVFDGDELLALRPDIAGLARLDVINLFNIPSEYMDPDRWRALHAAVTVAVARPEVAGVIVSHGTDTMEETAWFLDLTLDTDKPVVLVGAQRNASEVDFDGPRNLFNAVRICLSPEASGKGVVICLNDQINAAREASKTSTSEVATFKSGDFGFLGQVDPDAVRFYRSPARRQHVPLLDGPLPRVDIVPSYAGADGVLLRAAAEAGARGVVLAALGCGNVPLGQYETLRELVTRGVAIVIATRVPNGRVFPLYGYPGGGRSLAEAGAAYADNLSPQHARVLLMLGLQHGLDARGVQALFALSAASTIGGGPLKARHAQMAGSTSGALGEALVIVFGRVEFSRFFDAGNHGVAQHFQLGHKFFGHGLLGFVQVENR